MSTLDTILGRAFAHADSEHQAELLNAAGRDARRSWGDRFETQCCAIVDALDEDGRALIEKLADYVRSDREARR